MWNRIRWDKYKQVFQLQEDLWKSSEIMQNSLLPCGMYGIPGSCSLNASATATPPKSL